ncbi:MAG: hypothetical protein M3Y23_02770, partial [Actinomycetota bacterium]|nr:hypothetical protein [Actinomycetota bacterium]
MITLLVLALGFTGPAKAADDTVTLSGNAWTFVLSGTTSGLEGAVIKVAEFPELETVTGPQGAWSLEVPNGASVTPYSTAPGYYQVHSQTFFTRNNDLSQVNFQMPPQETTELLAAVIGAETQGEAGSKVLKNCGVVSTVYQKEGRSFFEFNDFLRFAPHGVVGSTAMLKTQAGDEVGDEVGAPIYFNKDVIPDRNQLSASRDGGIVWEMPPGLYTGTANHETARFSQFQATCEPGRLVNASPPWGLYEMNRNEEPNPAVFPAPEPEPEPEPIEPDPVIPDTRVEASLKSAKVVRKGKKRFLQVKVDASEKVRVRIQARQGSRKVQAKA